MRKAIAVDFDGCLCENAWPEIGPPNWAVIRAALEQQRAGAALILWTCRSGELLDKAVAWCAGYGLTFDAVNETLPERLEHYGSESRKVSADEYWDDLAVRMPLPPGAPPAPEKLRALMDAERDGRLAVLPCKVGDTVFDIQDGTPYATRVLSFSYFGDHWACRTVSSYPDLEAFGERVFLTLEEAEAALERRNGGNNETD